MLFPDRFHGESLALLLLSGAAALDKAGLQVVGFGGLCKLKLLIFS